MAKKKSPNKKAPNEPPPLEKPQDTFKEAVKKFKEYKGEHPNGKKKMSEFVREEFLKRK